MTPFYGWGSTASRLEPLRGDSLLFTTKFPETTLVNQTAKNRILLRTCSSTDPQSNIWDVSNNIWHISHIVLINVGEPIMPSPPTPLLYACH